MSRRLCWIPVVLGAVLFLGAPATAGEGAYGPVPEGLAAVEGPAADEALAAGALEALERITTAGGDPDELLDARALLVLLGDTGLKHVAERLAEGDVGALLLPHLLHVVAAAQHPAADVLLGRAATEDRSHLRMMVAEGLGRGRTGDAPALLDRLARDEVPGVRAAALRALFALESETAVAVRQALPVDERSDLHARRLRWHRLRGCATAGLRPMTLDAWRHGITPDVRLEAAHLLILAQLAPPLAVLERIVAETGTDALGAAASRLAFGVPRRGYDPLKMRTVAILAAWHAFHHAEADDAVRQRMADRMVDWLAQPVRTDPFDKRPIPENILRLILPDLAEAVVEPTLRRLARDGFRDPQDGVILLLETLEANDAAAVLRRLLDPEASASTPTVVRIAAGGGLRTLGRVGDEVLARALLRENEEGAIRRDVVRALAGDDATWAIPLLSELASSDAGEALVHDAVAVLELRTGEEPARSFLIERLFECPDRPEVHMEHLVAPADETAFAVLERALTHRRGSLRRAALRQIHQVPALQGERALALLREYEPRSREAFARTHELQQLLYAWSALAPCEGIRWMRKNWQVFRDLDWDPIAIRTLQNVCAEEAVPAVVDLVLEKVHGGDEATPGRLLQVATTALEGRTGYRDDDLDTFWRRVLSHPDVPVVWSAVRSLDHPGRGDLTDLLLPLLDGLDTQNPRDLGRASELLDALEHQPWAKVEPGIERLVLDVDADPPLRRQAAVMLLGRASQATRSRLLTRLTSTGAGTDDPSVLRLVAHVVGTGGDAHVAETCFDVLESLVLEAFDSERELDPDEVQLHETAAHVGALARAIAFTGHAPTIDRVMGLVFEERFARFARHAIACQGRRLGPVDATASARPGPGLLLVWHRRDGVYRPMPWEVSVLLDGVKPAGDEVLAASLQTALETARSSGRLAAFPDLYLDLVLAHVRDRPSGDLVGAAEVVERFTDRAEPVGGATDFGVARSRVERFERSGRYAEATEAQARVVRILSRRAYDDEPNWNWRRERSAVDAWRGAAWAAAGRTEAAERAFAKAVARNPYDAQILQTTARARARTNADPEAALALARRARVLERRVRTLSGPSIPTADTLALVLLRQDRFAEAAAALRPVLARVKTLASMGGRFHLRYAEALAGAGDLEEAAKAILEALALEPTLEDEIRSAPLLAPLAEDGRLEELFREAEQIALEPVLD